ncbi:MAG: SLC13 family permease, partial [Proteobacteria bacterium]|nr:SLC13 family permease [Pseudomonadota bacterium]
MSLKIFLLIAASLALSVALQETGGAAFLAHHLIEVMDGASPLWIMSALFFLMMVLTNVLSNNAAAVLFT